MFFELYEVSKQRIHGGFKPKYPAKKKEYLPEEWEVLFNSLL